MAFPAQQALSEHDLDMTEFVRSFLDVSRISLKIEEKDLSRIPTVGPGILVVNCLFGPVDPILLLDAISSVRHDVKVLSSYDFSSYGELKDHIVPFDMDKSEDALIDSIQKLIEMNQLVVVFPAKQGTISRITANMAIDKRWHPKLMRVLFRIDQSIQPIHVGTESLIGLIHSKTFSFDRMTAFFQDLNSKEKHVRLRVGNPIGTKLKARFTRPEDYARFVRAKLYSLGSKIDVNSFFSFTSADFGTALQEPLAEAIDPNFIELELNALNPSNCLIKQAQFKVFLASASQIPKSLKEIGRLREITFRTVGEGSGDSLDLDEYDMYYHQLILWDQENKKIAGGYRIGFGHEIMELYGKRGFYLHSLFKFRKPLNKVLEQSIELGRSYVTPEYQKARLPLFLLWKGILVVLLQNLGYRYLIGPVSISNEYSSFSRQLIVEFIKKHYWNEKLAKHVKPRKVFAPPCRDLDIDAIINIMSPEVSELDKIIEEVEPKNFKLPVLVKKYIKQEAKIIGFNLDPKFSNVLDGLIVLDMMDIPAETLENLNRELH
ncbi:MAG: lysophospholipid acyltransferase family protein [Flavobacteriales bacterium]|nr:lysophospholipid acyltransferase family protein [Flavobacteriales bacterium]